MIRLVFILAFAIMSLQSCNGSQAKNPGSNNGKATDPVVSAANANEGEAINLTKQKFLAEVWDYESSPKEWKYKGSQPAIIDFYANWCGPCKIASPILDEIASEYAGKVTVYKVNTEVERELASVFGVKGIPAFLYIPMSGKPTMTSGIARSKDDTKKMFQQNIEKLLLSKTK